jgi:hypothetical protein
LIERLRRLVQGKGQSAAPIHVTLWGKSDCSLCDKAAAILERIQVEFPLEIEKRDITADPVAFERYRYVIPVVEIRGGRSFEGKITEHRLRLALQERAASLRSSSSSRRS